MISLKTALQGYTLGTPQSVGIMRVIPILSDTEYAQVGGMESVYLENDEAYQTFVMANDSGNVAVIPHGLMYVLKTAAQDRTIPSAHLMGKTKKINVNCLQPSQGGHFSGGDKDREWGILPKGLKEAAWNNRHKAKYDVLWPDIRSYLNGAGVSGNEIVAFFRAFKDELDTFIAQFEPVPNQLGAIFIINNVVVGIEIVPNYKYWKQMWQPLVRDCYGSEAIVATKKGQAVPLYKPILRTDGVTSIEDIEQAVNDLLDEEVAFTNEIISEILDEGMNVSLEEALENFTLYSLSSENLMGQRIMHGPERTIYLSLVTKLSTKLSERRRTFDSRWNTESPYSGDRSFSLT